MKEGGGRGERRIEGMGEKDEKRRGGEEGRGKKRKEEKIRMAMIHCKKNNTLTTFLGVSVASV